MKKYLLMVLCGFVLNIAYAQTKVLFIGNSYTAVNNLPQLTYDVALSTNDTLIIDFHTPGGTRLMDHANNPLAISKIYAEDWNYVVLQAQSQEPSWPIQQVQTEVFSNATILCDTIRANNACSMPVFYMTWGRKNGDSFNCPSWPPVCTYEGMDSLLNERYQTMGEDNNALVAPVGAVWHYIRDNYPGIDLYSADESHPSMEGSFAAACTFYTVFLRKDPTQITFNPGFDPVMIENIKWAVKAVAYDSLLSWNVGEYDPVAAFDALDTSMVPTIGFTNLSINADSFYWDFGDGNFSNLENPTHNYIQGIYTVTLIASRCGVSDTTTQDINVIIGSVNNLQKDLGISVFPNPTNKLINVEWPENVSVKEVLLFDARGKQINVSIQNNQINVEGLANGVYMIKVITESGNYSIHRILKQ